MSAKKNTSNSSGGMRLLRLLVWEGNLRRAVAASVLVAVVLWFAGRAAWLHVRDHVTAADEYCLSIDDFHLTPLPVWITTDVRTEAVRATGLDRGASILDDDLVDRVARGFALHPWIADVVRVVKSHPSRIDVEVVYRRPTAMVEVPEGLYPVDAAGVWLPTADFLSHPEAAQREYPRLGGIATEPIGPVGTYWGDPRVRGGAKIGAALVDHWVAWRLKRIAPSRASGASEAAGQLYEIETQDGARIHWGHEPDGEIEGEPAVAEKLAAIERFVAARQQGGVSNELDLRQAPATPRTAERESATAPQ